jgi:hypothetical protein
MNIYGGLLQSTARDTPILLVVIPGRRFSGEPGGHIPNPWLMGSAPAS